jgi:DNA-binding response OmpR family regulator
LLVDDDKDLVASLKVVLEANDFVVDTSHNGTEAMATLATQKPDAIVLDVMMDSDTEGFGVAYKLESDPATRRIPVILLTGFMDHMATKREAFDVVTGRDWPAAKLMKKPVNSTELVATLRQMIAEAAALAAAVA